MNILYLLIAGAIGILLGIHFGKGNDAPFARKKQKNLEEILTLFTDEDEITNRDIQELLNVSEATAIRYLDELQEQGRIEQIGETGQGVLYRLIEPSL